MKTSPRVFLVFILAGMLASCGIENLPAVATIPPATPTPLPTFTPAPTRTPTPTPLLHRRLETGTYIQGKGSACTDCHTVTIVNNIGMDVVVVLDVCPKLTSGGGGTTPIPEATLTALSEMMCNALGPAPVFYIRAGDSFTLRGVGGAFRMCYTSGEDWDGSSRRFTRNSEFSCMKNSMFFSNSPMIRFKQVGRRFEISYYYLKVTYHLNPLAGEPIEMLPVPADEFPSLSQ